MTMPIVKKARDNKGFAPVGHGDMRGRVSQQAENVDSIKEGKEHEARLRIHNNNISFMEIHDGEEMLDELYADYKALKAKYA
ncbi:hypothetical protein ACLOJK_029484 [Asimina triloba]